MPQFTYVGDSGRYYPFLAGGLTPEPDSEHELDEAPDDGRWQPAKPAKASTSPAPADATDDDTPGGK